MLEIPPRSVAIPVGLHDVCLVCSQSKEALSVVEKVLRFVDLAGSHIPWSNMQRKALGPFFEAASRACGPGSYFYSVAPDDVTAPLAQRMCFAHQGADAFPAKTSPQFDAALSGTSKVAQVVGSFDMTSLAMQKRIVSNPVAGVIAFRAQMRLLDFAVGHSEPSGNFKASVDVRDALLQPRKHLPGFGGYALNNACVVENNQRHAQHAHGILHSSAALPPDGLASIVSDAGLRHQALSKLDDIWRARLPWPWHLIGAALSSNGVPHRSPRLPKARLPALSLPQPPRSSLYSDALDKDVSYGRVAQSVDFQVRLWYRQLEDFAHLTVVNKNLHVCDPGSSSSCTNGTSGKIGCRYHCPWGHNSAGVSCVEVNHTADGESPPLDCARFDDSAAKHPDNLIALDLDLVSDRLRCIRCYAGGALHRGVALFCRNGQSVDDGVRACISTVMEEDLARKLVCKVMDPTHAKLESLLSHHRDRRALHVEAGRPPVPSAEVDYAPLQPTAVAAARVAHDSSGNLSRSVVRVASGVVVWCLCFSV